MLNLKHGVPIPHQRMADLMKDARPSRSDTSNMMNYTEGQVDWCVIAMRIGKILFVCSTYAFSVLFST